jgi:hypothetical protein
VLATGPRVQAGWCESLRSPLYASLLRSAAADLEAGGPTSTVPAADQLGRLALLDGALEVARGHPVGVGRPDAGSFLEHELAQPVRGVSTDSVFWQHLDAAGRDGVLKAIRGAQARAALDAPVCHLRMEPAGSTCEVRLDAELLAATQAHGKGVRWLVSSSP